MKKRDKPCVRCARSKGYSFMGRVWVDGAEGTFLGHGRVELLERIKEHGSISEAARSMEMSYRHAWSLLESMNRQSKKPLIETATGGKGGGGARLTTEGERVVEFYRRMDERFERFLLAEAKRFKI